MVVQHVVFDFLDPRQNRKWITSINLTRGETMVGRSKKTNSKKNVAKKELVFINVDEDRFPNPTLDFVRQMLSALMVGDFGILERGKEYVQTIRGSNGFHLEQRETLSIRPYRFEHHKAGRIEDVTEPAILELEDFADDPEDFLPGFSNELLGLTDVLSLFADFWNGQPRSEAFVWREVDLENDRLEP
jgi:hypothetical protein